MTPTKHVEDLLFVVPLDQKTIYVEFLRRAHFIYDEVHRKPSPFLSLAHNFHSHNNQNKQQWHPTNKASRTLQQSLSNLDLSTLVKSEFLPLTDPKAAAHQQTPTPTDVKPSKPALSSDDYWAWTPSVETAEIEETLSVSHIEEQLLRDAQRRSQKVETVRAPTTTNVDYWDEATETDTPTDSVPSKAQHEESYWEWKSDAKDVFSSDMYCGEFSESE